MNADIPSDITIHFVDDVGDKASPIGGKGVGELGATGVAISDTSGSDRAAARGPG